MGASVKVNVGNILDGLSDSRINKGKLGYAREFVRIADPYVPLLDGYLRQSVYIDSGANVSITWARPYATRVFEGKGIYHWTTAGTGARWDKKAIENAGNRLADAFIINANWG